MILQIFFKQKKTIMARNSRKRENGTKTIVDTIEYFLKTKGGIKKCKKPGTKRIARKLAKNPRVTLISCPPSFDHLFA